MYDQVIKAEEATRKKRGKKAQKQARSSSPSSEEDIGPVANSQPTGRVPEDFIVVEM
jgi:hypothetical protein